VGLGLALPSVGMASGDGSGFMNFPSFHGVMQASPAAGSTGQGQLKGLGGSESGKELTMCWSLCLALKSS